MRIFKFIIAADGNEAPMVGQAEGPASSNVDSPALDRRAERESSTRFARRAGAPVERTSGVSVFY
jgi:hypothetical protein